MPRLILASTSKARKKLLKELGHPFKSIVSGYQEDMEISQNPRELATLLSWGKVREIASSQPDAIIIGADTFITVGKIKIGKPVSIENAREIILSMSGKIIQVYTGVTIVRTDEKGKITKAVTTCEITRLKLKKMTAKEIEKLANHRDALKISGAFSIEGPAGKFIETLEGDYDNVIGLPLKKVQKMLQKIGHS